MEKFLTAAFALSLVIGSVVLFRSDFAFEEDCSPWLPHALIGMAILLVIAAGISSRSRRSKT